MKIRNMKIIPQPHTRFISGNLSDMDEDKPVQSLMRLADQYGDIFKLRLFHIEFLVVSSEKLVKELSDEKRFEKKVHKPLENLRAFARDGLFTAFTHEKNWELAHRILMPAFSPLAVKNMLPQMKGIARQLTGKWMKYSKEGRAVDVTGDMTRLTLDTIALCSFNYKFNSFEKEEMHPFIHAMVRGLQESFLKTRRLKVVDMFRFRTNRQYRNDIRYMNSVADNLIAERARTSGNEKDLLYTMLNGKDPLSGESLSKENIRHQLITFLVAGHETTSGLLSFALYHLMKNPKVLARAYKHVDEILGDDNDPGLDQIQQLSYIEQILQETLRLAPTAPAYAVQSRKDTLIGGKYPVKKGQAVYILLPYLHRDPDVWERPGEFIPERFGSDSIRKASRHGWKPFGNGIRACIGRAFAMQEATLALAMLLQHFEFTFEDPSYQLSIRETLTFKPDDFRIHLHRRHRNSGVSSPSSRLSETGSSDKISAITGCPYHSSIKSILVLYGSNGGLCERFAHRIASDIKKNEYSVEVEEMDRYKGDLLNHDKLVIVTSTYEGKPAHNAEKFVRWLSSEATDLNGLEYAVLGCGNHDWAEFYQTIPRYIDRKLEELGGNRILEIGEADVAGDFLGNFNAWYDKFNHSLFSYSR